MAPGLSYREKTLYASLLAEIVVYGPYFFLHQKNSVNKVAGMIIAIIVLQVVLQLIIAAFTRHHCRLYAQPHHRRARPAH